MNLMSQYNLTISHELQISKGKTLVIHKEKTLVILDIVIIYLNNDG